ncbi:MAG: FliA/WhiG family RNA polymerase sigma factor [Planctomycetes bacterium]|nr:FliA/WhiG family RNA polymerase sigma factor [Planctomycetota bacterium]
MATRNKYIAQHLTYNAGTAYDTPIRSAVMRTEPVSEESHNNSKRLAQQAYANQDSSEAQDERIVQYLPLVHKIVQRVTTYIKPPLTYDDLVSAGTLGLIKASHNYDASHQAEFQTYAYIKIRGAVLDELRAWSFVPAQVDRQIHAALQTSSELKEATGRPPSDELLAEKLDVSVEKLTEIFKHARIRQFLSIDTSQDETPNTDRLNVQETSYNSPFAALEQQELIRTLTQAIQELDERPRQLILLYYQQELTMKQIADVFEITEARVSQLHAKTLFDLSISMRQWNNE